MLNLPKPKELDEVYEVRKGFLPVEYYLVDEEDDYDINSLI
jgi:hypothetical protein